MIAKFGLLTQVVGTLAWYPNLVKRYMYIGQGPKLIMMQLNYFYYTLSNFLISGCIGKCILGQSGRFSQIRSHIV